MPGFDRSVLTDVGWDALTDAEAGQHIEYTHLEAGDGHVYGGDAEIYAMTNLVNKVMNFPITNFSNDGAGQITLIGVISSKNVTTGFQFREIGVRCTIDGGPSILYAVANAGEDADYMPSSAETGVVIQTVQIAIKIDRAENVTVVIQPGLDVTAQNIGPATVGPGYFRDKIGQVIWLKRINSPKKTLSLTETSDVVSIDIPVVDINLDMFVALGNPDIFPNFSTIQKALDYLIPLQINPGITATITVAAGKWIGYPTTIVDHPQGSQIRIIGTIGTIKNITSATGNSSAVTLHGGATAFNDMAVGDYFFARLTASGGTGTAAALSGIRIVTAKTASSITFNPWWYGPFPANIAAINGGTVTPMKTALIQPTATSGNMLIRGNGLGLLKNIVSVGGAPIADPGPDGIWGIQVVSGAAKLEKVGAYQWQVNPSSVPGRSIGIGAWRAGALECVDCSVAECASGFIVSTGGVARLTDCFGNSNEYAAYRCVGEMTVNNSTACGNATGFICEENSTLFLNTGFAAYNAQYGLLAWLNAYVSVSGSQLNLNTTRDIHLVIVSSIIRTAGPAIVYGTANIAPYALSNDGCYFSP